MKRWREIYGYLDRDDSTLTFCQETFSFESNEIYTFRNLNNCEAQAKVQAWEGTKYEKDEELTITLADLQ